MLIKFPDDFTVKQKIYDIFSEGGYDTTLIADIEDAINLFNTEKGDIDKRWFLIDIFASLILYGCSLDEYFEFDFPSLNHKGRSEYFCDQQRFDLFRPFYDFSNYEQIRNKWNQYLILKKYFNRQCIICNQSLEYEKFFLFVKANKKCVYKPTREFHGNGIEIYDTEKFSDDEIKELYYKMIYKEGVLDQLIIQDECMAKFHRESVNTIRILAIQKNNRIIHIHPQIHFGRGDCIVDNSFSSIRANIDIETGIVYTPGYDHMKQCYVVHPDCGEKIVGFKIPNWSDLLHITSEIMMELDKIGNYIGFDMALCDNKWSVVEINPFPQMYSQQLVDRKGYRWEIETLVKEFL